MKVMFRDFVFQLHYDWYLVFYFNLIFNVSNFLALKDPFSRSEDL